jgi:hypothetical protein
MKENRGKGSQGWNIRGRKVKDLSIGIGRVGKNSMRRMERQEAMI